MPRRQPSTTEEITPTEEPLMTGRLRRRRSHQQQKTVSACHVSLNIGTVILVSDSLLFHYC